ELSALPVSLDSQPGDSLRSIGLELEFDLLPGLDEQQWAATMRGIIADLHRFGLSTQPEILDAHGTRAQGYTRDPRGWRLEREGTVEGGGELVSPILRSRRGLFRLTEHRPVWTDVA